MAHKRSCLITASIGDDAQGLLDRTAQEAFASSADGLVIWYAMQNSSLPNDQQRSAKEIAAVVNEALDLRGEAAFSYQRVSRLVSNPMVLTEALETIRVREVQPQPLESQDLRQPLPHGEAPPCVEPDFDLMEPIHGVGNWMTYHQPRLAGLLLQAMELTAHVQQNAHVEQQLHGVNTEVMRQQQAQSEWRNPLVLAYDLFQDSPETTKSLQQKITSGVQNAPDFLNALMTKGREKLACTSAKDVYENTCAIVHGDFARASQDIEITKAVLGIDSTDQIDLVEDTDRDNRVISFLQKVAMAR